MSVRTIWIVRSLIFVLLLSMVSVACAPAPTPEPTSAPAADQREAVEANEAAEANEEPEPITLTLWTGLPEGQPFREVLDNAIARYEEAYPYVEVNVVSSALDVYKTKFAVAMAAGGTDFDVFQTWGGGQLASYARRGQLLDLTDTINEGDYKDRFSSAAWSFVSADDKIWAMPIELAVVTVYYNKDLFEANNVSVPETFDDLLGLCTTFSSNGTIPLVLGMNKNPWTGDFFYQYLVTRLGGLDPFRKAVAREPGGTFEDPVFIEAGQKLQQMVDAGCFQEGFIGAEYPSMRQLFGQEQAAMVLMGTWMPGQIATEYPDFFPKVDYFLFPSVAGGQGGNEIVGGTNGAFGASKATEHPEEAIALIKELASDETAKEIVEIANRLPAVKYDFDPAKVNELTIRVANEMYNASGVQLYYDQASTPGLATTHLDLLTALMGKQITPEEHAAEWEAAAKKELE